MCKTPDPRPYTIDESVHRRFDQKKTIFGRIAYDRESRFFGKSTYDNIAAILSEGKEGYSRADLARVMGAWTAYDYFDKAFSWRPLDDANNVLAKPVLERFPVQDPAAMSDLVKETARFYGALDTGIAELNERWVYSRNTKGESIEIPGQCRFAIVMTVRMGPAAIATTPTFAACAETGLAYSRMAFTIGCLAEFIRNLGYRAIPMGNDTALSIPLAVDAGLGEMGRNGLLATPEEGPCVRICKVFTDMPLETDRPIHFGLREFCGTCARCADACEADAIRKEREPSYDFDPEMHSPGVLRWAVDHEKCFEFWMANGGECSNCIAACPFSHCPKSR